MPRSKINFHFLMQEARARRKRVKLRQKDISSIANVSAPTVASLESGLGNVELGSIVNIFRALGMLDERHIIFPNIEDAYCTILEHQGKPIPNDEVVVFSGHLSEGPPSLGKSYKKVTFTISKAALREHYGLYGQALLKIYYDNQKDIEYVAFRKYLEGEPDANGWFNIRLEDI